MRAPTLDRGGAIAAVLDTGVVTIADKTPRCTCTWTGRRRAALFLARHDAWMHAATTGCLPGVPLMVW
jgi:hypothetical protein